MISDGYAQWYANRLWQLLPAIYRSLDVGPTPGSNGPLRELINRIGAQAAVVRRNIDRLGENQSIETCDDWVIPYIGDLVATRLVSCLDAAAQRIDVAKTIYYRRRAGTVGVLEELAADIASRDARVIEFFRRMGRTRHQFDPPLSYQIENTLTGPVGFSNSLQVSENDIAAATVTVKYQSDYYEDVGVSYRPSGIALTTVSGAPSVAGTYNPNGGNYLFAPADFGLGVTISYVYSRPTLEIAEGLIGAYSNTPAGGFADLRNRYAASNTGSAFDEYFYTADLRAPGETLGHFNIRNLGVFIWWLQAFPISAATPVSSGVAPPCFTFDPTGRDIPLFAQSQRVDNADSWGEHWVSPDEWELPVAIRETLWNTVPDELYSTGFAPQAFSVGMLAAGVGAALPSSQLRIHPERGRFSFTGGVPAGTLAVCYNFGLMGEVGAGGYDNSILKELDLPEVSATVSGGDITQLNKDFGLVAGDAQIEIQDSLTYPIPMQPAVGPAVSIQTLTVPNGATVVVSAQSEQRPVFRWTGAAPRTWMIVGDAASSGSPTILVLEGILLQADQIVLQGAFDSVYLRMMTLDPGSSYVAPAKGAPLNPPMFASAIDNVALAPCALFIEAAITNLYLERCITGPIRTRNGGAIQQMTASDSIIQAIPTHAVSSSKPVGSINIFDPTSLAAALKDPADALAQQVLAASPSLASDLQNYKPGPGAPSTALTAEMAAALANVPQMQAEAAWPLALADLALGFDEGTVSLSRCTVMGRTYTHAMSASESILDNLATVVNPQTGCVRFSAYATGSNLHRPYRSVQVAPNPSIFVARAFGQPGYAQLRSDADSQIVAAGTAGGSCSAPTVIDAQTILAGAQNGSEMGVYCLEDVALKRRGLALKFEEYSPIGQLPVWIDVD
jgi:hypothetical protein